MRRVIGIDIHRTFGEVFREDGRLSHGGRVDMTRTALEGVQLRPVLPWKGPLRNCSETKRREPYQKRTDTFLILRYFIKPATPKSLPKPDCL
jgi:hypothetical protein